MHTDRINDLAIPSGSRQSLLTVGRVSMFRRSGPTRAQHLEHLRRITPLHQLPIPAQHFEFRRLALAPEADIEPPPAEPQIGQGDVGQPARQHRIDQQPPARRVGLDAEDCLQQFGRRSLLVGDIVLMEVLRGAYDERHAARLARDLRAFEVAAMLDETLAVQVARNYRMLRGVGVTIRKMPNLIIGTYCIEHGHALLHDDRDFEPMRVHLGLQVV